MSNKMIPFPNELKITHSDFFYYGIYYFNKDRHSRSLFCYIFFISIIKALGRMA